MDEKGIFVANFQYNEDRVYAVVVMLNHNAFDYINITEIDTHENQMRFISELLHISIDDVVRSIGVLEDKNIIAKLK